MRKYFLTKDEREDLRKEIVTALASSITTSERVLMIQTVVRWTWSSVCGSYCGRMDGDLITRLLHAWDINENSTVEDLSEFADNFVFLVGQTDNNDYWSKD